MTAILSVNVLGSTITVSIPDPAAAEAFRELWRRCLRDGATSPHISLAADERVPWAEGATRLAFSLNNFGIGLLAGSAVILHAAGVCHDNGATLALVAPSGTGKTTAASVLCTETFGYVTDETLAVLDDGRVLPFPKPLAVLEGPGPHKTLRSPDSLGLLPCPEDLSLAGIVLLDRDPSVDEPTLRPVLHGDAILALIRETGSFMSLATPLETMAGHIAATGGVWRLTYADIASCTELLQHHLCGLTRPSDAMPRLLSAGSPGSSCAPVDEAVEWEDDVLLRRGRDIIHLAGVGAAVWLDLRRGTSADELPRTVQERLGHHPDAAGQVADAIRQLEREGLVTPT